MPPEPRFVIRFAAEPPQEGLPYGRWAEQLQAEFLAACLRIDTEGEEVGEPGEITWFPDRGYGGQGLDLLFGNAGPGVLYGQGGAGGIGVWT